MESGASPHNAKAFSVLLPERFIRTCVCCTFGPRVIRMSPEYDPSAVSTLLGIPESVTPSAGTGPLSCGIHLVIATLCTIAQIGRIVKKYLGLEKFLFGKYNIPEVYGGKSSHSCQTADKQVLSRVRKGDAYE